MVLGWCTTRPPAAVEGFVERCHQPARGVANLRTKDNLSRGVGQEQPRLPDSVITPQELMTELVAVEAQTLVEIRNRDGDGVDQPEEG
jgi:hypothetical protein